MSVYDGDLVPALEFITVVGAVDPPPQWQTVVPFEPTAASDGTIVSGTIVAPVEVYDGDLARGAGEDWFEHIIVLPRSVDVGFILGTVTRALEVYNSYRWTSQVLAAWSTTAGEGIDIPDLPALPVVLPPQSGIVGTLTVYTVGPPTIDGDIVFTFSALGDFSFPIVGVRAIMIPFAPEAPMTERLRWSTDVVVKLNGDEQRAALRDSPRQVFDVTYMLDGHERRAFLNVLFDGQGRAAGFPVWTESTIATAPVAIGATVVSVESTANADWRVGSLGVIWADSETFEVLEVDAVSASTVTFGSATEGAYPVGSLVMPVRASYVEPLLRGSRPPRGIQTFTVRYSVIDNAIDLASVAAFPTYQGKVYLSEPNLVDGDLSETFERDQTTIDGDVGVFRAYSDWDATRRGSAKKFLCRSRLRLWQVRSLLHALRGRAASFYLPTFWPDLEATDALSSVSTTLEIKNVGYTTLVRSRSPQRDVRVVLTNGTAITRRILSSVEVSDTVEELTVDAAWGIDVALGDIDHLSFVEKVRFDSDEIEIRHLDATGQAIVSAPVKAVLE